MKRKWIIILIVGLIAFGIYYIFTSTPQIFKSPQAGRLINDPHLEEVINNAIGRSDGGFTYAALREITNLSLSGKMITDIGGLGNCSNLVTLDLYDNKIEHIGTLIGCTKLNELNLGMNQLTDISTLSYLKELSILNLDSNNIIDITPLTSLTALSELYLSNNQISNVGLLVANTGLSEGDLIVLENNPLNEASINTYIPQLIERGVNVRW